MCTLAAIMIMLTNPPPVNLKEENNKIFSSLKVTAIKVAGPYQTSTAYIKIPTKISKISKNSE